MERDAAEDSGAVSVRLRFALVVAFWASLAWDGLWVFFSGDDLMNLYNVFVKAPGYALAGILRFWSSDSYRPLGGLVYIALYDVFGFDPRPFRVAGFLIVAANLWLALRVLAWLLGSQRRGVLALLLVCYNARMNDLYLNFGTVYEMLCFMAYYGAFLLYLRTRQETSRLRYGYHAGALALYVLALAAKEMAVSLPVVLLAYEMLLAPVDGALGKRLRLAVLRVSPYVALTSLYVAGKLRGPESLANLADYRPHLDLESYLRATSHYLNNALLADWCSPRLAGATMVLALAASLATRAPRVLFAYVLFVATLLPVSFIVPRSGFVLYLATIGLGAWIVALVDWLLGHWRWAATRLPVEGWRAFLLVAVLLWPVELQYKLRFDPYVKGFILRNQRFYESFLRTGLHPAPGSQLLLLDDPFEPELFDPLFLLALSQHDPRLEVHRVKMPERILEPLARYDYVLDYAGGEFTVLKGPGQPSVGLERVRARLGTRLPAE